MLTAIVSDLHLGTTSGADIALRPAVRERLAQALAEADRVVLLGDLLELRERPVAGVLELAAPAARRHRRGGGGQAGRDRARQPRPRARRARARGRPARRLGSAACPRRSSPRDIGALSRRVAARMPRAEVVLAYPGRVAARRRVRHPRPLPRPAPDRAADGVRAGVGHRALRRRTRRTARSPGPDDYEAALSPIYALRAQRGAALGGARPSRAAATCRARSGAARTPTDARASPASRVGSVGIPAAVAALNAPGPRPVPRRTSAARSSGGPACGRWAR